MNKQPPKAGVWLVGWMEIRIYSEKKSVKANLACFYKAHALEKRSFMAIWAIYTQEENAYCVCTAK